MGIVELVCFRCGRIYSYRESQLQHGAVCSNIKLDLSARYQRSMVREQRRKKNLNGPEMHPEFWPDLKRKTK